MARVRSRRALGLVEPLGDLTSAQELEARIGEPHPIRGPLLTDAARRQARDAIAAVDAADRPLVAFAVRFALVRERWSREPGVSPALALEAERRMEYARGLRRAYRP